MKQGKGRSVKIAFYVLRDFSRSGFLQDLDRLSGRNVRRSRSLRGGCKSGESAASGKDATVSIGQIRATEQLTTRLAEHRLARPAQLQMDRQLLLPRRRLIEFLALTMRGFRGRTVAF